jgi:DNA repair protein RadC
MANFEIDATMPPKTETSTRDMIKELFIAGGVNTPLSVQTLDDTYPHLVGLAAADEDEVANLKGVGEERAHLLFAALELAETMLRNMTMAHKRVISSDQLGQDLVRRFSGEVQEQMIVFFLNVKNEIIEENIMFRGSIESSATDQRLIMRRALKLGSTRIVIAHNHPSGSIKPSGEDEEVTDRIFTSGEMLGIQLLDHIVVGRNDYYSFRESGDL